VFRLLLCWDTADAYRASKAALNMVALEWSRILKNDGVIVHLIDPGMMKTGFGGVPAEQKPKHPSPSRDKRDTGTWIPWAIRRQANDRWGK
jgi:NAD(P)-dependent dehydrogenase (short-subunit alcohol dehydrogenase family)